MARSPSGSAWLPLGMLYQTAIGSRLQRLASTLTLIAWPLSRDWRFSVGWRCSTSSCTGGLLPGSNPDPRDYNLRNLYVYGIGGLIGFPLGVLPFAPLLMVALVAVPFAALWVGGRATAAVAGVALGYWIANGYFGSAGFTVPGRYVVTIVPLLAIPLALVMLKGTSVGRLATAIAAMLTAWSTVTSANIFDGAVHPRAAQHTALWPYAIAMADCARRNTRNAGDDRADWGTGTV